MTPARLTLGRTEASSARANFVARRMEYDSDIGARSVPGT